MLIIQAVCCLYAIYLSIRRNSLKFNKIPQVIILQLVVFETVTFCQWNWNNCVGCRKRARIHTSGQWVETGMQLSTFNESLCSNLLVSQKLFSGFVSMSSSILCTGTKNVLLQISTLKKNRTIDLLIDITDCNPIFLQNSQLVGYSYSIKGLDDSLLARVCKNEQNASHEIHGKWKMENKIHYQ